MIHWNDTRLFGVVRSLVWPMLAASAAVLAAGGGPSVADAADAAFVGRLALAVDESVARQLELSDETKRALTELIDRRENEVLELTLQVKGLAAAEQEAKLKPFREESEQQGLKLLSETQRQKLEQIRLQRLGNESLRDSAVAARLKLSDSQQAKIDALLKEQTEALAKVSPFAQRGLRADYDRKLAAELDDEQRKNWDELVGRTGAPTGPGDFNFAQRQGSGGDGGRRQFGRGRGGPGGGGGGAGGGDNRFGFGERRGDGPGAGGGTPVNKDTPVEKQPIAAAGDGKIRFNSRFQPWRDVLEWFAEQAELSLVLDNPPPGTFNYQDARAYTPAEAIDQLNYILGTKGYTLIRRDRTLMLVDLANPISPDMIPRVSLEELDQRGQFELVQTLFKLQKMTPEEGQAEVEKLLGPHGKVVVLPKTRQLSVTDTAGRLKTIRGVIDSVENPDANATENLKAIAVRNVKAEDALNIIKQLLNIPADRSSTADGSVRVVADSIGRRLLVSGKPDGIKRVEEVLAAIDGGSNGGAVIASTPQLEVYPLGGVDSATVLQVLQTLMAGLPNVRLATDPQGRLIALATPEQHSTIQATIQQMQQDAPQIAVLRLRNVDPQAAVLSINKLFAAGGDATRGPKVEAEPTSRQLIVRGTLREIEQIRTMLEQMGETDVASDRVADSRSNVRIIPLTGRNARTVLGQLEHVWPTMRKNKVNVITPSSVQPPTGEGASLEALFPGDGIVERRHSAATTVPPIGDASMRPESAANVRDSEPRDGELRGSEPQSRRPRDRRSRDAKSAEPTSSPAPSKPEPNREASRVGGSSEELVTLGVSRDGIERIPFVFVNQAAQPEPKSDEKHAGDTNAAAPNRSSDSATRPGRQGRNLPDDQDVKSDETAAETSGRSKSDATDASATEIKRPGQDAPIIVAPGAGYIMIASEDQQALDDFEALIKTLGSRSFTGDREFTVFYLKYAKAATVHELVTQIFGGSSTSSSGRGGSLLGDIAGAAFGGGDGGGLMGNLLFGGGGDSDSVATTVRGTSGVLSIVPDSRLNALVVQGSPADLDSIEQLLKVLDQPGSPEDVLAVAKPRMIPVYNKSAEGIAEVVRQVYSNRIVGAGGQQRQPSPEDFIRALRGGGRGGRGGGGRNERTEDTQQMTVGVDVPSNSLVVAAPEPLFNEVRQLVTQLDEATNEASNDTMRVVTLKQSNAATIQQSLQQMLGPQVQTTVRGNNNNNASRNNNNRGGQNRGGQGQGNFQGGFGRGGGGGFQGGGGGFGNFQGGGGFGRGGGGGFQGGGGGFGGGGFQGGGGGRGGRGGGGGGGGGGRGGNR